MERALAVAIFGYVFGAAVVFTGLLVSFWRDRSARRCALGEQADLCEFEGPGGAVEEATD